jgi:hypothetical protein
MVRSVKTQSDVDEYLDEWKTNINAAIASTDPDRSIEVYPAIHAAFKKMAAAWNASFSDQGNLERIVGRDRAILELGKAIAVNLK